MQTQVLPVNEQSIALAAELLRRGELVALPTETVYGIAADARNGAAVEKIFAAKGRPQDNPLIVHIAGLSMCKGLVADFPPRAQALAKAFWPGPLTMVLPRGPEVADVVCAGLDTIGLRMPSHPVVQAVIRASGVAFAAPSANLSGKPSPTNAADTLADMDGRLPLILDGGDSAVGVESTVVSLAGEHPVLLRPGLITAQYRDFLSARARPGVYALCFTGESEDLPVPAIEYGDRLDGASQAHRLFTALRELDKAGAVEVYARCPKSDGVSMAVYNRLLRAAAFRVVEI